MSYNPITHFSSTHQLICSAGGLHAKHNAGDAFDPGRRKSMSAHSSNSDLAGQQPLPDWILRQRDVVSRGHSRLAQPPTRLEDDSPASQVDGDEGSPSRPRGDTWPGEGSSHGSRFKAPGPIVTSLTPFSAFAQHSQQTHSRSSSGSAESDPDGLNKRSGGLGRKRSGSFGGRGVALGFMMEAQQQWRQDSFTKAAERRRNEQSSESGRSSHNSLLSNSEQHAGQQQHVEAGVTPGAGNQPSPTKNHVAELKVGRTQEHPSTPGTTSDPRSVAGPENPGSAGTAGQAAQAQTLLAMQNPFLAAAQQWRETSSSDSTDQSQHSTDGSTTAVPPQQPSRQNHFADSAAIAEQWLADKQELLEQSGPWDRPGGDQGIAHTSSAQEVSQSGRGHRRSHTAQQDSAQQDPECRETHIGVPFSSFPGPRRSMSAKAGPPPEKISSQKSPPAIHSPGMWCAVPAPDQSFCTTDGQLIVLVAFPLLPRATMYLPRTPCLQVSHLEHVPSTICWSAAASVSLERQISRCVELFSHSGQQAWKHPRCMYVCMFVCLYTVGSYGQACHEPRHRGMLPFLA